MENLATKYSSSSPSGSPARSKSDSDDSDDFRVISVSAAENIEPETKEAEATEASSKARNLESPVQTTDTQIAKDQLKNLEGWVESINKDSQEGPPFTEVVRRNKNFRNPAIFEKMISYCGIDEFGTNIKGRKSLSKGDYYKDICDVQELCMKDTD